MRSIYALLVLCGVIICLPGSPVTAAVKITENMGDYLVETPVYRLTLADTGALKSLSIGENTVTDGPVFLGPTAGVTAQTIKRTKLPPLEGMTKLNPTTICVNYQAGPVATYDFADDRFTLTVENKHVTWDNTFGIALVAPQRAQMVNNQALPMAGAGGVGEAAFLFENGDLFRVAHSGPGNPFNSAENGSLNGYSWGRWRFNPGGTYTITFSFEKGKPGTQIVAAPSFVVQCERTRHIFDAGEPLEFSMSCDPDLFQRAQEKATDIILDYKVINFWDKVVAQGSRSLTDGDLDISNVLLTTQTTEKGWFQLVCTMRDKANILTPNTVSLDFAIVTPTPGLLNLPLPANPGSYEMDAFLGLKCVREGIALNRVFPVDFTFQPEPDIFGEKDLDPAMEMEDPIHWDELDAQVKNVLAMKKQYGITVFWLIENVPAWLKGNPAKMEEALFKIAERYNGKLGYVMLWNEPNLNMGPADYVKNYLGPLYRGMKRADPNIKIMGPDTCGINPGWLAEVYKAGGKMDVVDMHPYTGHNRGWEEHGMAGAWAQVRDIMKENGDGDKEIWSTENGFDFGLGDFARKNHVRLVTRQFPVADSAGIPREHHFYYYTCEMGFIDFYLVSHANLLPSGVAVRVMGEQTVGKQFAGEASIGKNKRAYRYASANGDTLMCWSLDFDTTTDVFITTKKLVIFDCMGNVIADNSTPAAQRTKVALKLTGDPIYIQVDAGAKVEATESLSANYAAKSYWDAQKQPSPTVTASSEAEGAPASRVIDGVWNSENTGSYEGKTWSASKSILDTKEAWVEIALPQKKAINTAYIYAPSPLCGMPGLRSIEFQIFDADKNAWRTVSDAKDQEVSWVFECKFPTVTADKVRLLITDLNNGFLGADKKPYTNMQPQVTEIEVYERK